MANEKIVNIQRIYTKDLSFEAPSLPQILRQEWHPEINVDLNVAYQSVEQDFFEVTLAITVTARQSENTIFLAEVHEAGIFQISGFSDTEKDQILHIYCATVLFPYARELISDLTMRASFPPLYLAPVNFELVYREQQKGKTEAASSKTE